jgi:LPS-assembly lipoprotein
MRKITIIALLLLTAACGFQLRGQAKLPFQTLYVGFPEISTLGTELKRNIIAGTSTKLVNNPNEAQAILTVVAQEQSKTILSFDTAGRVREYQLRFRLRFRVHDPQGRDYLPQNEILITRDISFNDAQVLAKEAEEVLLYRDMQTDMVQQVLRRLAAAPAQPYSFDAPATPR